MSDIEVPAGWDEDRIRRILDHYETQSDEDAAAEDDDTTKPPTVDWRIMSHLETAQPDALQQPDAKALDRVCRRYGIRRLSVFGSAAKGTLRPDSDLDLLVEFEPDRTPDFFTLDDVAEELSSLFGGRTIDLVTEASLNRHLRPLVLRESRVCYRARP